MPFPLVNTEAISEFGDLTEQSEFRDPQGQDYDFTYVPGYSDMKRRAEQAVVDAKAGKISAKDIPHLPVKAVWVRNQKVSGTPDTTRTYAQSRDGFRFVTKEDLKEPWLTSTPPGATWQADGTLRTMDTVLMVCSAQDAAREEIRNRNETEARLTGAIDGFSQRLKEAGARVVGQDPTITTLGKGEPLFSKNKK